MVRKGYPFSKRREKQGASLVSGLLAAIISAPFSISTSPDYSTVDSPNLYENDKGYFFKSKLHYILGAVSVLLSACCIITYVYCDWWLFFSILLFGSLEYVMYLPLLDLRDGIRKHIEFNELYYKQQVKKCKNIVLFWFLILSFQLIFEFLLQYLPEWKHTDTSFVSYGLMFLFGILKLCLWGISLFNLKDINRLISENNSYQKSAKVVSCVDINLLCNIYDNSLPEESFEIGDGFLLKALKEDSMERCGFVLSSNRTKYIETFYFRSYYTNPSQLFTEGRTVLKDMAENINKSILIQNIAD